MRKTLVALAAIGAILGARTASADIIFTLGNHPQADEQNILFTGPETGTTITGEVDHTGIGVNFNTLTGQTLQQTAQGQADIFNLAGTPLTSMETSIPGFGFTDFIMNPVNGTGSALVTATDNFSQTFTYSLGNGQNFLTLTTANNEFITDIKIHMWTAPACEGVGCASGEMVRCSHMSGLSVRCL